MKFLNHPGLQATIIQLPYKNSNLTLTLFYPNHCGNLRTLIRELYTTFNFMSLNSILKPTTIELYLPKFYIDFTIDNVDDALSSVRFCIF